MNGPSKHKLRPEIEEEIANHQNPVIIGIFHPPCFVPKSPTQSAGPPLEAQKLHFLSVKILIIFRHQFLVHVGPYWAPF